MKVLVALGSVFAIALLYGVNVEANSSASYTSGEPPKGLLPSPHLAPDAATTAVVNRTIYTGIIAAPLTVREMRAPPLREQTLLARTKDWTDLRSSSNAPPPNAVALPQLESLSQSFVQPISRYTASVFPAENAVNDARNSVSASSNIAREQGGEQNVSPGIAESTFLSNTVDTRFSQTAGH